MGWFPVQHGEVYAVHKAYKGITSVEKVKTVKSIRILLQQNKTGNVRTT